MIRNILYAALALLLMASCRNGTAPSEPVTQKEMAAIYEAVKTPHKYGLVVAPTEEDQMMDSPTVFRHEGRWYMTYLIWNPRGYQTCLAESDDLLHWHTLGLVLPFRDEGWDRAQRGGYAALVDPQWGGSYELERFDGHYWMTYLGGAREGYESKPLSIGMAYTDNPIDTVQWTVLDAPVLSPLDKEAGWFETETQYKSAVFRDSERHFGHDFVMFYNAFGYNADSIGAERIGIAFSDDMLHWQRYDGNPVVAHDDEGSISGDAHIQRIGEMYVMFYFRAFDPAKPYQAYNTFACSRDLVHWYDWQGDDLIYPTEDYDARYAHKSYLVNWDGVTYHFYCAVDNKGHRGIAVATSKEMGKSDIHFVVSAE